jgi:hypothetical protein
MTPNKSLERTVDRDGRTVRAVALSANYSRSAVAR